jgi:hypothetical protein
MTSWSRNRKHLAETDSLRPAHNALGRGHFARPLCDAQTRADVFDQEWLDAKRELWFGKPPGSQLIVNLPPCRRCEKKASAREAATS